MYHERAIAPLSMGKICIYKNSVNDDEYFYGGEEANFKLNSFNFWVWCMAIVLERYAYPLRYCEEVCKMYRLWYPHSN